MGTNNIDVVKNKLSNKIREGNVTLILISNLEKERDDAIAFLRKCQRMSPSSLCDAVDKYINDYDLPF